MAAAHETTWGFRLSPRLWPELARRVRSNPGDVELGARVFFSVGGHDDAPTRRRLLRAPGGEALLRERRPYPPLFTDYETLRALPEGTLGHQYVRELDERGIRPLELAERTRAALSGMRLGPEHRYVHERIRAAHDLYHTLTGYGTDVIGEAGALAFTFGQTGNKSWAMLVLLNCLTTAAKLRFDGWGVAWRGWRAGRRARFLAAVDDWERLLRTPLEAVRRELGVAPTGPYRPLALDEAFAAG